LAGAIDCEIIIISRRGVKNTRDIGEFNIEWGIRLDTQNAKEALFWVPLR
jgi:hypothetical protein